MGQEGEQHRQQALRTLQRRRQEAAAALAAALRKVIGRPAPLGPTIQRSCHAALKQAWRLLCDGGAAAAGGLCGGGGRQRAALRRVVEAAGFGDEQEDVTRCMKEAATLGLLASVQSAMIVLLTKIQMAGEWASGGSAGHHVIPPQRASLRSALGVWRASARGALAVSTALQAAQEPQGTPQVVRTICVADSLCAFHF